MQQDTPTAEVGKLGLQGFDMRLAQGELQFNAIGSEVFFYHQPAQLGDAQFHQVQFGETAGATQRYTADQLDTLGRLQAFVGATTVGTGEAAGAQLDAAVPANHQHRDLVKALCLDGGQDRSPGRTAGFTIVIAAVLVGQLPGPAVVRGVQVAVLLEKCLGLVRAGNRRGEGNKAAFAYF